MRPISELKLNEGGAKVQTPPPTPEQFALFERTFGVLLPNEYKDLLLYSNGGHPELDTFRPRNAEGAGDVECINRFYHLGDPRTSSLDLDDLWQVMNGAAAAYGPKVIPIGDNGGGDEIVLDCECAPARVLMWIQEGEHYREVADTFSEFIDGLFSSEFE